MTKPYVFQKKGETSKEVVTKQLEKLRKKYAARLLLLECNIHKDKISAYLSDMKAANVAVKTRKVSLRGV